MARRKRGLESAELYDLHSNIINIILLPSRIEHRTFEFRCGVVRRSGRQCEMPATDIKVPSIIVLPLTVITYRQLHFSKKTVCK
jgi:hypothetical protein